MNKDIKTILAECGSRATAALEQLAVPDGCPETLAESMKYAVMGGGKRLRPAMVFICCDLVCGGKFVAEPESAAVAIELIHCYSLVHDDLPAMDDDLLRRGKPTVHAKYGEAMAILVGDALLTRAFEILAAVRPESCGAKLAAELALGAGPAGMIAGQVADMDLCDLPDGVAGLEYIHARKTAALFASAARLGAICGGGSDEQIAALGKFAYGLGMAFQVTDDILDTTATASELGKTPGKDAAAGKRTYPALMGLDASREMARRLSEEADSELKIFGDRARPLQELACLLLDRKS